LALRPNIPWWTKPALPPDLERSEEVAEREARREPLRQAVRERGIRLSERGRELMAQLLDFHTRAKKPEQWAVFDRCARELDELIDDGECIGDISPAGATWRRLDKRSEIATYRYPEQETKLRERKGVLHAPTMETLGTIVRLDRDTHIVEVRRGAKTTSPWPVSGSIIPGWPLRTNTLEAAIERVTKFFATGENAVARMNTMRGLPPVSPNRYQAIVDILERAAPRMTEWGGGNLVREGESLIDATTARTLVLDNSALFIQGPPGTGKTHTSAHVIVSLITAGKRVGVSSNSHKAINNLLSKIEEVAEERGITFDGVKKASSTDPDSYLHGQLIIDTEDNEEVEGGNFDLIGGTAWLFAREGMDQQLDYLFVDEAGQVSLGHLVAMGAAAKNIILVGDQMQLGQPIQGAHPGESGLSTLDYLLQGKATIAPDRGILLDVSWRMHPSIQGFISNAVYDGRLRAHPDCSRQILLLEDKLRAELPPYGIHMIAMDHRGCSQRSDEEVKIAAKLMRKLIGQRFVDRDGNRGTIGLDNILVVAPYNLQVNALKEALPQGARVGTVDKFQGQEAEVVIVSLATSTPDDLPRHVDFFYSKNRLNVAISRARTLAIVLANPRLLELDAKSVEHLRLVNTLAWLTAHSRQEASAS
jgi:AAA domain